jgi:hypothetical protein
MATAQEGERKMLTTIEMIAYAEKVANITDKSDEEKLALYEQKYNEILRKKFAQLINEEKFVKHFSIVVDCIDFYRQKLGLYSLDQELEMLAENEGDLDELLMINPALLKYVGTKEFLKVPIIVPVLPAENEDESS